MNYSNPSVETQALTKRFNRVLRAIRSSATFRKKVSDEVNLFFRRKKLKRTVESEAMATVLIAEKHMGAMGNPEIAGRRSQNSSCASREGTIVGHIFELLESLAGSDTSDEWISAIGNIREALIMRMTGVERARPEGGDAQQQKMLSYDDLRNRLTIGQNNPRTPSLRTVKEMVRRYRSILRPVQMGHKTVGFRECAVERLLSHLSGVPGEAPVPALGSPRNPQS